MTTHFSIFYFIFHSKIKSIYLFITYLPHAAVAEVSNHKEPIGRGCVDFNWFESQLLSDSSDLESNDLVVI